MCVTKSAIFSLPLSEEQSSWIITSQEVRFLFRAAEVYPKWFQSQEERIGLERTQYSSTAPELVAKGSARQARIIPTFFCKGIQGV